MNSRSETRPGTSGRDEPERLSPTQARQAEARGVGRYVLAIGMILAVVALAVVLLSGGL